MAADVWSVTSFGELRKDGIACDRWNLLHPAEPAQVPYVTVQLAPTRGPVIAASDFVRAYPDLIRNWIPRAYTVLGTDGFGRSDTRVALRDFFEIDSRYIVLAALRSLADDGALSPTVVHQALVGLEIDPDKPDPRA